LQLLLFGVLSALFAMPLGIGVANLMVEVVLRQSFGWTMPLIVIPWDYAETFLWTMVALLVAGAIPVAGIMRRTPMKSLRDAL
jgi:putative ABC transport system permease protein